VLAGEACSTEKETTTVTNSDPIAGALLLGLKQDELC
jgi:hypothetical protein